MTVSARVAGAGSGTASRRERSSSANEQRALGEGTVGRLSARASSSRSSANRIKRSVSSPGVAHRVDERLAAATGTSRELQLGAQDRQRGAQLVTGVGDEAALALPAPPAVGAATPLMVAPNAAISSRVDGTARRRPVSRSLIVAAWRRIRSTGPQRRPGQQPRARTGEQHRGWATQTSDRDWTRSTAASDTSLAVPTTTSTRVHRRAPLLASTRLRSPCHRRGERDLAGQRLLRAGRGRATGGYRLPGDEISSRPSSARDLHDRVSRAEVSERPAGAQLVEPRRDPGPQARSPARRPRSPAAAARTPRPASGDHHAPWPSAKSKASRNRNGIVASLPASPAAAACRRRQGSVRSR